MKHNLALSPAFFLWRWAVSIASRFFDAPLSDHLGCQRPDRFVYWERFIQQERGDPDSLPTNSTVCWGDLLPTFPQRLPKRVFFTWGFLGIRPYFRLAPRRPRLGLALGAET